MAYFSALGGTGGTSATITVTYSEDFYGVTITATNGTTTLTKTATSSGTLVFDVSEGGTWVVSGTVEGATYSESVDVTFEYTAPPLVALPDGSTALPVNDIQMWLKCAAIRDKTTYTTLADVLADTDTFIALCADSNASDYMARSTTWALQEGLVPVMTDNTHPSGVAFSSGAGDNFPEYGAFDRVGVSTGWNNGHQWNSNSPATSQGDVYLGYEFPSSVTISKVGIWPIYQVVLRLKDFAIAVSDDGTNYDIVLTGTMSSNTSQNDMTIFDIPTPKSGKYIKLIGYNTYSDSYKHIGINELQFYQADITTNPTAMQIVGMYGYCANALRNDNTWNTAINNSAYASYVPVSPVVPTGTVIHSAVEDTTYYMEGGESVPFCTIASGDTETVLASTIESLKNQTITLYSSVAKDPTNLSNDYSKSIRITPNVTEIYLMPNKALYWWGHFNDNCQILSNANGWTGIYIAPDTSNKNYIFCPQTTVNGASCGIGSKTTVSGDMKAIYQGITARSGRYGFLSCDNSKEISAFTTYVTTTTLQVVSANGQTNKYVSMSAYGQTSDSNGKMSGNIYALWYE